jgi:hypothetical protein
MRSDERECGFGSTTVNLAAVLAVLAVLAVWRPWAPGVPTEARLRARFAEYAAARRAASWRSLYEIANPDHRGHVGYEKFLEFYGQDFTRVHDIALRSVQVDAGAGKATTDMEVELELVPERIPARFQRNLSVADPNSMRTRSNHAMQWTWRGGDWYFDMERVVLTGRDPQGRPAERLERPK